MAFVITAKKEGKTVYWQKWTGSCIAGRPKWTEKLTIKCAFAQESVANKTVSGTGSSHFQGARNEVQDIQVEEMTLTI